MVILLQYQNIKIFLRKVTLQIDLKKFCGYMLLMILTGKKLLEHATKENCKKQIKNNLELKK